jgi:hypothetical protein
MFAYHPAVTFISNMNIRYTNSKVLWRINTLFNKLAYKIGLIKPAEHYPLFNNIFSGYGRPFRTLKEFDVTENIRKGFLRIIRVALKYGKKERFLYKITGWSRIRFLNELFPDALFINIIRDGRAVANSFLEVDWWEGWQGPQNWRWGELSKEYKQEWEKYERSFTILAGIQWKILMDEFEESREVIDSERILILKYENLVENPIPIFKKILEFCGLTLPKKFKRKMREYELRNTNYKWKENLQLTEQQNLTTCLSSHLKKYGYL